MTPRRDVDRADAELRAFALEYSEAWEDHPWGERVIKVRRKVFLFTYLADTGFNMTVKLPTSNGAALMQPFATPAGYGLGRAGWVTCQFGPADDPPIDVLKDWIDESYRAVAPKALWKDLPRPGAA